MIRSTYRDLWDKAIPSWKDVFPPSKTWPFSGAKDGPATHVIKWEEQHGSRRIKYEMIVEFRAIGDMNFEEFARGLYATWIWLNEADTIPGEVVGALIGRLGRYPAAHTIVDDWPHPVPGQVFVDLNAPNTTNWTYKDMIKSPGPKTKMYIQPSGFSEHAENPVLRKLKPDYYRDIAQGMEDWQVKRFIENKVGYSRTGKPIYTEFDSEVHCSTQLLMPALSGFIGIGIDPGLQAAAVFGQKDYLGRVIIPSSIVTPDGMTTDAESFGQMCRAELAGRYPGLPAVAMLDPAANQRCAVDADQRTWMEVFAASSGIPCIPAPTNAVDRRHKAVRKLLTGYVGAQPRLCIDRSQNETLVEGFLAGYRVRRLKSGEDVKYMDQPEKNGFSHVHDAMQYLALLFGFDGELLDEILELHVDRRRSILANGGSPQTTLNDF